MASVLRGTIDFLKDFGMFDVILPFLLIFTIIFAILEKTMILGKENGGPKKNLNSIVALVIALFFVSANKAVNLMTNALPNIALLIVIGISFLMMVGVFLKQGELDFTEKHENWYKGFFVAMFIGLILVFLGAYEYAPGTSLLSHLVNGASGGVSGDVVWGIVLLVVIFGLIGYVVKGKGNGGDNDD